MQGAHRAVNGATMINIWEPTTAKNKRFISIEVVCGMLLGKILAVYSVACNEFSSIKTCNVVQAMSAIVYPT